MKRLQEDAVTAAYEADLPVAEHPLLDRVRACSANPDMAAEFFTAILHPMATWRLSIEAGYHFYVGPTTRRMLKEFPLPDCHFYSKVQMAKRVAERKALKPGELLSLISFSGACLPRRTPRALHAI